MPLRNRTYGTASQRFLNGTFGDLSNTTGDRKIRGVILTSTYTYSDAHLTVDDLTNEVGGDAVRPTFADIAIELDGKMAYLTTSTELFNVSSGAAVTYRHLAIYAQTDPLDDTANRLLSLFTFDGDQVGTQCKLTLKTPVGDDFWLHKQESAVIDYNL